MPATLWCPVRVCEFVMPDAVWEELVGSRIRCPACSGVHDALKPEAPPAPPPVPFILAAEPPAEDLSGLRWLVPTGRNGWAIASGYLGLISIFPGVGIAAILTGVVALRQLWGRPEVGGRGRAWIGIVLGVLFTAYWIFIFLG